MFEVDMAIERNMSALKQIEPIVEEVVKLKEDEEKDGQPIGRMHYELNSHALNSVQIGAIARVYGESGDEVVQHLKRNPLAVLPIVFRRITQKDEEWVKARAELTKQWRSFIAVNFEGSLDVLCHFYKREIERSFAVDHLLEVRVVFS
jgi:paired amphipathic helix protein Sin3a